MESGFRRIRRSVWERQGLPMGKATSGRENHLWVKGVTINSHRFPSLGLRSQVLPLEAPPAVPQARDLAPREVEELAWGHTELCSAPLPGAWQGEGWETGGEMRRARRCRRRWFKGTLSVVWCGALASCCGRLWGSSAAESRVCATGRWGRGLSAACGSLNLDPVGARRHAGSGAQRDTVELWGGAAEGADTGLRPDFPFLGGTGALEPWLGFPGPLHFTLVPVPCV